MRVSNWYGIITGLLIVICLYSLISLSAINVHMTVETVSLAKRNYNATTIFPRLVLQTWKSNDLSSLPRNLISWRDSCSRLNSKHDFELQNDKNVLDMVTQIYPEYVALYRSLHGVYMADMARVLLVYHFGGTYMDFDFYCTSPLDCLSEKVLRLLGQNSTDGQLPRDILVVSREPVAHALLFRNKTRVVIQDFFLSTPKHPFLKWLLDDRLAKFVVGNVSKGPFSYSIEKDIDKYMTERKAINEPVLSLFMTSSSSLVETDVSPWLTTSVAEIESTPVIIELAEDYLHPLVDATNSRLWSLAESSPCNMKNSIDRWNKVIPVDYEHAWDSACERLNRLRYLESSPNTIAVHMWSHVYLSAPKLRSALVSQLYRHVERSLPPSLICPQ